MTNPKDFVVSEDLKEQTNYLLYGHKKAFSGHPSKRAYRTHIKKLQEELDGLRGRYESR
jgi:hypothetical protein